MCADGEPLNAMFKFVVIKKAVSIDMPINKNAR